MRVHIPALGTVLMLNAPEEVTVHVERRNWEFLKRTCPKYAKLDKRREAIIEKFGEARRNNGGFLSYEESAAFWKEFQKAIEKVHIPKSFPIILKPGPYKVERIYIRLGATDFDSVTLRGPEGRFWIKLDDFNTVGFLLTPEEG